MWLKNESYSNKNEFYSGKINYYLQMDFFIFFQKICVLRGKIILRIKNLLPKQSIFTSLFLQIKNEDTFKDMILLPALILEKICIIIIIVERIILRIKKKKR